MLEEKDQELQENVGGKEELKTTEITSNTEEEAPASEINNDRDPTEIRPEVGGKKLEAKEGDVPKEIDESNAEDAPTSEINNDRDPTEVALKDGRKKLEAKEGDVPKEIDESNTKEAPTSKIKNDGDPTEVSPEDGDKKLEAKEGDVPKEIDESNAEDAPTSKIKDDGDLTEVALKDGEKKLEAKEGDVLEEIDESNAEDAEDEDNQHRHSIPILDYHSMSMENLVGELQRLVRNEKVQAIKKHVDGIKYEFDLKFQEFLDQKKEEFIGHGGNEIDFKYNSVTKRQFNEVYGDYREKRDQYYKNLEQSLKSNLSKRLEIIEELKGLINVEEDINTTYQNFKNIQERWRNAGPVPRNHYNDVWKTYHHHIEIFYDFLHLNRELRDLDFKHNYEEKLKIVERAEALANETDLGKAFRELQTLHKIWKEDIGPVGKEHREEIWERFSLATKAMHERRQDYYKDLDKVYEQNLEKKTEIIASIKEIASKIAGNHRGIQQQIKQIEQLRDSFFKAGKVPQRVNEKTWAAFKDAVRNFNRNKNAYYKNLKKEQQENLDKKKVLLDLAISLKDSEDWEMATSEMKRIQSEWKKIGHVPRKYSDKIWKEFKGACNHYFDRLHALKNEAHKEEFENFEKKNACLEKLQNFQLTGNREKDLNTVKGYITEWKSHGLVPYNKKKINLKFNKILDALFKKLNVGRQESELLKYGNKIQRLANEDNERALSNERVFIKRKISESKNEIRQLENNMQFFSNASEDSPLVQEVVKNLDNHKVTLATWKAKLKKLTIMENNLNKEVEDTSSEETVSPEEE